MASRAESTAKSLRSWSPTWRADTDAGSTRSSGKPHLAPRNGAPSSKQQRDDRESDRNRPAHDEFRRPVPEHLLDGLRRRLGSARASRRNSRRTSRAVQPVAEQHDRGRSHHDGGDRGERDHGDAGIGERLAGSTSGTAPSRPSTARPSSPRTAPCGPAVAMVRISASSRSRSGGELVAVPADDQQRVVDRQRQPHRDRQVEREDRHVGDTGDRPQHRHRRPGSRTRRRPAAAPPPAAHRTPRPAPRSSAESRWIPSSAGLARSGALICT